MKIVLFHPTVLPPRHYGGVERVVLWLAKGLIELGHQVWVGAYPGSRLPEGVQLIEFEPPETSAYALLKKLPEGVDGVHFMAPPEAGVWEKLPCAGVLTVHGNGKPGEMFPLNTVFLSQDHALRHEGRTYVYNGIDPAECAFAPESKEDRFLFLSKTSWKVKNVRGAVARCRLANAGLRVAGGDRPFSTRLAVSLYSALGAQMSWEGSVSGNRKADLLARAKALVFPVLWEEPFGLVAVEALMSGTPVLATPRGSLKELITPEVGCLLDWDDQAAWLEVLGSAKFSWDPEKCRSRALELFHYRKMAASYESIYRRVLSGETLHSKAPKTRAFSGGAP
jgi:glycosyltransferase involved in cell wall biosynthesis